MVYGHDFHGLQTKYCTDAKQITIGYLLAPQFIQANWHIGTQDTMPKDIHAKGIKQKPFLSSQTTRVWNSKGSSELETRICCSMRNLSWIHSSRQSKPSGGSKSYIVTFLRKELWLCKAQCPGPVLSASHFTFHSHPEPCSTWRPIAVEVVREF